MRSILLTQNSPLLVFRELEDRVVLLNSAMKRPK